MRISVTYNLRTDYNEQDAELLAQEDVDRICTALSELKHRITPIEVSGQPNEIIERLLESKPDLIFNVAEGTMGSAREAFYPGLFEQLGIPFTGGNASLLHLNLDKHLAKTVVEQRGIAVPKGDLITAKQRQLPANIRYPLIIKPNSEGSSKGITQDSVVETPETCAKRINELLPAYPSGLVVEEFIAGRELSIPLLEAYPGGLLEIVEHTFDLDKLTSKFNIYDYDMKQGGARMEAVDIVCPALLDAKEKRRIRSLSRQIFSFMNCPDFGRIDVRLSTEGIPYFIEINLLPSLHPMGSLMTAARACNLTYKDVMRLIVRSAARRFGIPLRSPRKTKHEEASLNSQRPTAREFGITVGRMKPGVHNAITDVPGVMVGHFSRMEDNLKLPGIAGVTSVRTGVTAVLPSMKDLPKRRLVAGGFVLNGIGEMAGLTQVLEWGWLETPILLTNSVSVGRVQHGVVSHMQKRYPQIGVDSDILLPVVGETDDSFLNDVRLGINTGEDAQKAIATATGGPVAQGSIGAGTGMMSFDFAGGIGSASRTLMHQEGGFTIGVIVLSNFGRMVNLTIDGGVIGRRLDTMFPKEGRRGKSYGSAIVVVATDAPLLASQLSRLAKRAALGLGRVGSHAASTSGEIIVAFSTANRSPRSVAMPDKFLTLKFIADPFINPLYEAVVEATEEAVLNAIFCSGGMNGREQRFAPPIPQDRVDEIINPKGV